jgi:hypothetical protein
VNVETTINLQAVQVEVIPSADTPASQELTARELWALETLDKSLRAFPDFAAKYPNAQLVRVDSMRLLLESTSGRYYLRYSSDAGMVEFWGHVSRQARFDLKRGIVSITSVPSRISSDAVRV